MALPKLTSSDAGAAARGKLNAVISAVDGLVSALEELRQQAAIDRDQLGDLNGRVADLARSLTEGLEEKADAVSTANRLNGLAERQAGIEFATADLGARLRRVAVGADGRPGDSPTRYATTGTVAAAADLVQATDIPTTMVVGSVAGFVIALTGSAILASRTPTALETGRLYRVRYVVARRANASDPAGDAVVPGLLYLDQSRRPLPSLVPPSPLDPTGSLVPIATLDALIRASGRRQVEALIARSPGLGAAFQAPASARYAVPVLVTYGLDGVTDVEVLHIEDVTGAFVVAPPVAQFEARVANLESQDAGSRLTVLEDEVGTPTLMTFPSKGDASTGSIPASVQFTQLLGDIAPGDGRGGLYQRFAGPPPAGSDGFTTTGGAFFLRVGTAPEIAAALLSIGYVPWARSLPTDDPGGGDQAWMSGGLVQVTP